MGNVITAIIKSIENLKCHSNCCDCDFDFREENIEEIIREAIRMIEQNTSDIPNITDYAVRLTVLDNEKITHF